MILLLSNKDDLTTDLVVSNLTKRQAAFYRLNTEDLPSASLTFESAPTLKGVLSHRGHQIDLSEIRSVWNRRPGKLITAEHLSEEVVHFVEQEFAEVFQGLSAFLAEGCFWMNHPWANDIASNKLTQLGYMQRQGYPFPRTLVTNDPECAWRFYEQENQVLCKSMRQGVFSVGNKTLGIYSWLLPSGMKEFDFATVRDCPTLFQQWIPKTADIRLTAVGDQMFSVRIESQASEDTRVDWRVPDLCKLPHSEVDTPGVVQIFVKRIMDHFHLHFAALDFVEGLDGVWVFLEVNPNGQWAWLEALTRVGISNEIAETLVRWEETGQAASRTQ